MTDTPKEFNKWFYDEMKTNTPYKVFQVVGADGFLIAQHISEREAKIIAAAPELLEALEMIRDDLMKKKSKTLDELGWINLANAAIAKARGQA